MLTTSVRAAIAACLAFTLSSAEAVARQDTLAAGFKNPPSISRPHTWWHWMNGNVTREGITADLEAMKRIGLGGAQIFNVSESIPDGPIVYNSDEWRALVKHAAKEAERLGLELCIHNCAGWSSSGGPWVTPEFAMQTLVASEAKVTGPSKVTVAPVQPPANKQYSFYKDIAVLAFPTPKDDAFRIKDISAKALAGEYRYGMLPSMEATPADASIPMTAVVDLTSKFKDGKLDWDAPAGNWTILRIGHTPTGAVCAPAPASGRGLEVDKMSREAFDHFWAGGMAPLIKELGPLAGKVLNNVLVDSYEMGCQNWTPRFREEFQARRGYDMLKFMPALMGRVIESGPASERFLWDFRKTVGELFAANYYDYFAETCRKNGLLSSVEPYDGPFECTRVGREADIVMGEFWVTSGMSYSCKLAASVSHIYGKPITGAESFTAEPSVGRWLNHPGSVKAVGDLMFTEGINRYIIHRYAHQPWMNIVPGMTMGQWGTHFERTTTWWEHGGPEWIAYLARCQHMLQAGRFNADVLFFAGDSAPNNAPHRIDLKAKGYDYDACGPDVLLEMATVKDGRISLKSGMSYRLLVLPENEFMSPAVAAKIGELAAKGATVLGPRAKRSPSLGNQPASDGAVANAAAAWDSKSGGAVISGKSPDEVLASMKVAPDAVFTSPAGSKPNVAWIHRVVGDADVYFVSNQKARGEEIECSLRVSGKVPELWNAETGTAEPTPLWREKDGRTIVTTRLGPSGSTFIVLRSGPPTGKPLAHVASITAPADPAEPKPPKIAITKAVYEAVDGAGGVDVTARVAAMVESGQTEIAATNTSFGDPTYNHVKRLRIEFTVDGKARKSEAPENAVIMLVPTAPDRAPAYRAAVTPSGVELVAFRQGNYEITPAAGAASHITIATVPAPLAVKGPWKVKFQPGRGAPAETTMTDLASWTESADAGIKYFSGTAEYETQFTLPADFTGPEGAKKYALILDLGSAREIAEVSLNSTPLGCAWHAPFSFDISAAAKPGANTLRVMVTNLWINRLIGDEQLAEDTEWARPAPSPLKKWPDWFAPAAAKPNATLAGRTEKGRLTFTTWKHWTKESTPPDAGLLGPVEVRVGVRETVSGAK